MNGLAEQVATLSGALILGTGSGIAGEGTIITTQKAAAGTSQ
jgi:hypothetical protein